MTHTSPELDPQARIVMEDIVGPLDEGHVFPDIVKVDGKDPYRYISYALTDDGRKKREGNVLTGMKEFDVDVTPDVLLRVAAQAAATVDAFKNLGFTIRKTGILEEMSSYQVQADKVVAIENLREELQALATMLELTKK